jgi:ABC-type Zn uptake system ZnuABC Zn-binding protein ZnuA
MKRKLKLLLCILVSTLVLGGCKTGKPLIGVTVYPVQYLVERLALTKVDVVMMSQGSVIQRATIIDDYEDRLEKMDVLFRINQLESYYNVYRTEIEASGVKVIDLSIKAAVSGFRRFTIATVAGSEITVESDYYKGSAFEAIDLYTNDPMLWMDPIAMTSMAKTILEWLVDHYPEEAKFFRANYEELESELARLDAEYQKLRLQKKYVAFVSMTPSFGNWQKTYGIQVYPIFLSRFGVYPSDTQLQLMKQRIMEDGIEYIALEPNLPEDMKAVYTQLINDLDLKAISLHNLAFLSEADMNGNKDYITLMYENLDTLEAIAR